MGDHYPADAGPDARAYIDALREQIRLLEHMNDQKRAIMDIVAEQAWERGVKFDLRGCA
jgi:hypothetical protein